MSHSKSCATIWNISKKQKKKVGKDVVEEEGDDIVRNLREDLSESSL